MKIRLHTTKLNWLFEPLHGDVTTKQIWLWWEHRRLFYNAFVLITAIVSFAVYAYFLLQSGHLTRGEDLIEPVAFMAGVILGPILWNLAYCLGPMVDIAVHKADGKPQGPFLFGLGLTFSLLLLSFPALFWAITCLQHKTT